jgi:hypothetical protein
MFAPTIGDSADWDNHPVNLGSKDLNQINFYKRKRQTILHFREVDYFKNVLRKC